MTILRIPCFLICYKNLLSFVGTLHQFHPKSTLLQAPAVQRPQLATIWPHPWPRSFFHFLRGVSAIEVGSVTLVGQPGADSKEPTKRIKFNWVDHIFPKQTTIWLYMYQRNPVYQRDMAITSKLCCFEAAQHTFNRPMKSSVWKEWNFLQFNPYKVGKWPAKKKRMSFGLNL